MNKNESSIWNIQGFSLYLLIVFINAFTDLGHKIIIQNIIFKIYDGQEQIILIAIVNALILIPFIILFSPAGFLSDKFTKRTIIRASAWFGLLITLLITFTYYLGQFELAFFLTIILAIQSAIYSPAKYGYIKELVSNQHLTMGNGLVQATTTVSIMGGIFIYSIFFESMLNGKIYSTSSEILHFIAPVGWALVIGTVIELLAAYNIPDTKIQNDATFSMKKYSSGAYLVKNLKIVSKNKIILNSIIGLALFWSVSQVILASFPSYAKDILHINNTVIVQGMMALAAIGIVFGSLISGKISKNYVETGSVPVGAIGMSIALFFLPNLQEIVLIGADFFIFGFFAGLFIIPLNSLIQINAKEHELGTILAGNNFLQNISMLGFLSLTVVFALFGINSIGLFYFMLIVTVLGSIYVVRYIPQTMIIFIIGSFVSWKIRLKVLGFNNIPQTGGVLLLGNHISWLDWAIIQMAMPRRIRFVMDRTIYEKWYLKLFLDFFNVIPISPRRAKEAAQTVKEYLNAGEVVCLFPEGAISRTGQLGEFKSGFELMAKESNAVIVPFYLRGMWGSKLSRSSSKFKEARKTKRRDIIIAFAQPMNISSSAAQVKQKVFELSLSSWEEYTRSFSSMQEAWVDTAKRLSNEFCMSDSKGGSLSYSKVLISTLLFSSFIKKHSEQNIGILMPTTSAGAIVNMATLMSGKTVVNLNYTAPLNSLKSAINKAEIKTIYTAKQFVTKLKAKGIDTDELLKDCEVFYMEDMRERISKVQLISTLLYVSFLPAFLIKLLFVKKVPNDAIAAILFSSGSEGEPKGVMLTHKNFMANVQQISDILNMQDEDVILASLPLFHAFGLTATTWLPLIEGIPMVCHPDPTDAVGVAKAVAKYNATVMFGTSTFLRLYARNKKVHPLMFSSLRLIVAGAEKLSPDVKEAFKMKFQKNIYEGYGVTESAPVASVNLPDVLETNEFSVQVGNKAGSIGLPIPGTAFKIVDPNTLEELAANEDGLILIGGPQVMKGYLKDEAKTKEVMAEIDGIQWYKTGDKGHMDEDGYLYIVDRYSRFAKLGGEMVSLGSIESEINQFINNSEVELIAVNLPDEKKGEKVVLLISGYEDVESLKKALVESGMNPLTIPAQIYSVEVVPKLGTGKSDFAGAKKLAQELSNV
ncbi:acyl-[ACP]--phospholipid O-acyltransferase [Sulfurimonas sp.]|uniref:acyl-[ACP]--phospholipid O-acyltransferase n=1 Tax=Sulfurimonas sp. TaxID=2022749 RepID=UPI003D12373B